MKQTTIIALLLAVVLGGCAPSPDSPVTSETPSQPGQSDYLPSPADGSLTRSGVYLGSVDLLTLESFPLQFMLILKGNLPTPCHQLRIAVNPPDTTDKIVVDVYSVANPDDICAQVLESFEVNYPLGSFPAGRYSLWVNGEMAVEFDS
jgi:hypothetical protein